MAGQFLHNRQSGTPTASDGPRRAGRFGRAVLLLTLFGMLAGCSLGFIYPKLDTVVGWQLDRYLRLESGQEAWLDERLEERLSWHQREQLPQWREAVMALRTDIANNTLDAERHAVYSAQIKSLIHASAAGLVDDAATLVAGLGDKQIEHFFAHYDEETEELQEELAESDADPEAIAKERQDELIEDIEQWLGKVNAEQKAYLQQWSQESIRWRDYALDSRQRWRDFIGQTLAARQDPIATRAAIEQMLLRPESLRSAEYQAAIDQQADHRRALHLHVLQSMTEKQRSHFLAELDDLLEELDDLLADPV